MSTDERLDRVAARAVAVLRPHVRQATHALIGPALIYGDGDTISVIVALGVPGRPGRMIRLGLGTYEGEVPPYLAAVADVVLRVGRVGGLTKREADRCRLALIAKLRRLFKQVTPCDDDLALATANVAMFPSAKARTTLAELQAEMAAAAE